MPTFITARNLSAIPGVRHGFFGRDGGTSTGIYASLNCGLGSNDARADVLENRARVGRALGHDGAPILTLYQVHSATALVVDRPFEGQAVPRADALVTRTPGLVIGALAADCTPVLLADGQARVVAAAHAGWRGALGGVLETTIITMEQLGASRGRIAAAIGPTINQPAYEVGAEFEAEFLRAGTGNARYFARPTASGRPHFDLPGFVEHRLAAAGIAQVERQSRCTYANESELFSYRRSTHRNEADYGRQISAIVVT